MQVLQQSASSNVLIGPLMNASGSVMIGLNIANAAIALYKPPTFASAARGATTSAASVGPGLYRIALSSADTGVLGETTLWVSASGALPWRERFAVWQPPTFALYYGSADGIATSANVAGVSGAVAAVSAAVAAVSAAVANVSARVEVVRVEQSADQAALSAQIAGLSATVAGVSAAVGGVSAAISGRVAQALTDIGLHVLVLGSASAGQPTNNSLIGKIMTSASADTYDRTTDSLAAQADAAAAGGVTSAAVSTIISAVVQNVVTLNQIPSSAAASGIVLQALRDQGLHVLVIGSASAGQPSNNSLLGKIMTSASADTYDRTTDSLAAQADVAAAGGVTSAAVSTIISAVVQNVVTLNQIPSSAAISGIVGGALTNADVATSADVYVMLQVAKADLSATVAAVSAAVANVSARVETVRVEQSADQALLSAQIAGVSAAVAAVSVAVANVSARVETVRVEQSADQAALSAQIAGVSAAVAGVSAAVAGVSAAILTSAQTSAIVEQAVFQRTLTEASTVPIWSNVQFDDAIEWMLQRNVARTHQASASVAIYSSAGNQIASASVAITSTSANQDRWL